jgi:hypothetical protein
MSESDGWRHEQRHAALRSRDNDLTIHSLAGWTTGTVPNDGKFLAIEFLIPPPEMTTSVIRFVMTRDQCIGLAHALELVAATPYEEPPAEGQ